MKEITEICAGRWKVRRIDSMNWQVFERREVKASGKTSRAGEVNWMACPAYFGKLEHALEWCLDREQDDGERRDLKDAVRQFKAVKTQFVREIREAMA